MFGFFNSLRVALLLGKAQKRFDQRRFTEALECTQRARKLDLDAHFQLLCFSLEGKARAHLGDFENALEPLHEAARIAQQLIQAGTQSPHLQNIERDITSYIEKIETGVKKPAEPE